VADPTAGSDVGAAYSTLQPLPYPYVVPGGRFCEVYYWDSYFTMLGLEDDGQHQLALDLLNDFAFSQRSEAGTASRNCIFESSPLQPNSARHL
jgi:hypothetical protein